MAKSRCTKVSHVETVRAAPWGQVLSPDPSSGPTWLVTETPVLAPPGSTPSGGIRVQVGARPVTPSWGWTTAFLSQEWGSQVPSWCHERNSKSCNVCPSTNGFNRIFPRNSNRVKNAAIFYLTRSGSSCLCPCMSVPSGAPRPKRGSELLSPPPTHRAVRKGLAFLENVLIFLTDSLTGTSIRHP